VKAALAMYSPTAQAVIHASKRNTAYLLPVVSSTSTSAEPPIITSFFNTMSSNDNELLENESSPFPVEHINENNGGGRHAPLSHPYNLDNDSTDDEILAALARNTKILEDASSNFENNSDSLPFNKSPIRKNDEPQQQQASSANHQFMKSEFVLERAAVVSPPKISSSVDKTSLGAQESSPKSTDSSGTSSLSKCSSSNNGNAHINQYYFHVGEMQLDSCVSAVPVVEHSDHAAAAPAFRAVVTEAQPIAAASQVATGDLGRYNYVPHQKTDRVVAIKNNYINGNSKSVQKLQAQKEHQQKLEKSKKSSSKSKDESSSSSKRKASLKTVAPIESLDNITQIDDVVAEPIRKIVHHQPVAQSTVKPAAAVIEPVLNASVVSSENGNSNLDLHIDLFMCLIYVYLF
jgi:hypothetical protein